MIKKIKITKRTLAFTEEDDLPCVIALAPIELTKKLLDAIKVRWSFRNDMSKAGVAGFAKSSDANLHTLFIKVLRETLNYKYEN